ncbi:restriction endonuclease subunit S [Bacteroides xylanisolvens]|uniref:restriction endonuclease subunit S n=1 Tax=Bacteroides xylanisolvens TaxID=371601 RepID=UPI001CDCE48B|nr:restriction endonuclease subunit S [Bacteroides xylanisolvens]MCA4611177.1 restriction endonuclease subunit S [Bacteroides xylanisolvens]MCA4672568.1 restriction endonuclease subunit S [Bacteroides xylanisolvens]
MTTTTNNEHKKLNVPNLRFKEFQGEWEKCKLGDYGKVVTGNTPPTKDIENYENGTYLWASPADLGTIKSITTTKTKLSSKGFSKTRSLPKGSVLVTCIGSTIGKTGMATKEMSTNQQINSIIVNDNNDNEFVYYAIQSAFPRYLSSIAVQAVPIISKSAFELLPNKRPCLQEQKEIGRFLSLLDERIATQNKIIDKLQSLIKGLNDSLYARYGNEVSTSFASLGTSYSGLSGKSAQDFGSGKPFITYLNVYSNNVINEKEFQYVTIKEGERQNVVEYGDVLFTLSSETPEEVGIGSVYLGKDKVYLNSFCFGIHITNTDVAFPPYLSYLVSSTSFRKFIYPYAQGSTRFNLCKADFEKASIKLPSLENQKRIYSMLKYIANKIETEKNLLGLYNSQKQYLLRQMFI